MYHNTVNVLDMLRYALAPDSVQYSTTDLGDSFFKPNLLSDTSLHCAI